MKYFNWLDPRQAVVLLCAIVMWMPGAMAAEVAASTHFVSGKVTAKSAQTRNLSKGASIYSKDVVETGNDGRIQMRFTDGGLVSLMPNSIFSVDEYRHDAQQEDGTLVFSLMKGGLRTVTGAIGKKNKANYKLQTPVGTLGIRGTEFVVVLNGPDVMQVHVGVGAVFISNDYGALGVPAGQSARMERGQPPVLTDEQPNFVVRAASPARAQQPPQDDENNGPGRADVQVAQVPMPAIPVPGTQDQSGDAGPPGGDGGGTPGGDGGGTPGGDGGGTPGGDGGGTPGGDGGGAPGGDGGGTPGGDGGGAPGGDGGGTPGGGTAEDISRNTGIATAMYIDGDWGDASLTGDVYRTFATNGRAVLDGSTGILKTFTPDAGGNYASIKLGDAGATMSVVNNQSGTISGIPWALVRTQGIFPDDAGDPSTWGLTGLYLLGDVSDVTGNDLLSDSSIELIYKSAGASPLLKLDGSAVGTLTSMSVNLYRISDGDVSADFNMALNAPTVYVGDVNGTGSFYGDELYLSANSYYGGFKNSATHCEYGCYLDASSFLNGVDGKTMPLAYKLEKGTAETDTTGQWDTYLGGVVLTQQESGLAGFKRTGMATAMHIDGDWGDASLTGDVYRTFATNGRAVLDGSTGILKTYSPYGISAYQNYKLGDAGTTMQVVNGKSGEINDIQWALVRTQGTFPYDSKAWNLTGLYMLGDMSAVRGGDQVTNSTTVLSYSSVGATPLLDLGGNDVGTLNSMSVNLSYDARYQDVSTDFNMDLDAPAVYVGTVSGSGAFYDDELYLSAHGSGFANAESCEYDCRLSASGFLNGTEGERLVIAYTLEKGTAQTGETGQWNTYLGGALLALQLAPPMNTGMLMALAPAAPVSGLPAAFHATGEMMFSVSGGMKSFTDNDGKYLLGTDAKLTVVNGQQGDWSYWNEADEEVGIKWGMVSGAGKLDDQVTGAPWQFTGLYMQADPATVSLDTVLSTANGGYGLYYRHDQVTEVLNLDGEAVGSLDHMKLDIWLDSGKVDYEMAMDFNLNDSDSLYVSGNGELGNTSTAFMIQGNEFELGSGGTCSVCSLNAGVVLMGEELKNAAVAYELKLEGDTYLGGALLRERGLD